MSEGYDGLPPYYVQSSDPLTPNLGLSLKGMDPIVAENFVLIDDFAGTGGGGTPSPPDTSVQFNTAGAFDGSANFIWDNSVNSLQITGSGQSGAATNLQPLEIHNSLNGIAAFYTHSAFGNGPTLNFCKSDGTQASPTAIGSGENLGFIDFRGYDGSAYANGAQIKIQNGAAWTPSLHSCTIQFYTCPAGSTTLTEVFRMNSNTDDGGDLNANVSGLDLSFPRTRSILWCVTDGFSGVPDTNISRLANASLAIGSGASGSFAGSLKLTILNAVTGIQINGGATSGNYLRGNGTNFVSSAIQSGDVLWSALGNAGADLTLANTGFNTTFNQTSAANWTWANITAATSGASQSSPILNINGTYWTGAASAVDSFILKSVIANGTNGQSVLTLSHTGTTGAAGLKIEGNGQTGAAASQQPLEIHNTSNGILATYVHSAGANGSTFNLCKSDGTEASPSAIASGEFITFFNFRGYDGSAYQNGFQIAAQSNGAFSVSNRATVLEFNGVKTATTALVEFFRIGSQVDSNQSSLDLTVLTGKVLGFCSTINGAADSAFSRLGSASIALGNGSAGDFTGTLKLTIANAITGYQVNGTAPSGNYLRGNGTNFVSSAIQLADLPAGTGTVTSIATTAPLAGGTITTTGTLSITGAAGQVLAGASPAFTATPTLGVNASTNGTLGLANGGGSGATITVQNLGATGAYNFNLPTTAGSGGQVLTSQGGGATSMTWSTGVPASSCVWSTLTDAAADLTLANTTFNSTFNQTTAVTWKWANITASTSSVSQSSPITSIAGTYWTGAASAADSWTIQDVIANGTNGTSKLTFTHSGSSGAATINVPLIQANANVAAFVQSASGAAAIGFPSNSLFDINFGGTSAFRFSSAAITTFAGATTVGLGVPSEIITIDLTAQAAAITATNLVASAPRTGHYQISWSATITTAGTTSVLGGTNGFQVGYTSPTDSVAKTTVPGNSVTSAANTTGTAVGGVEVVYAKTGTAITYAYDYTSTGTAMNYELHIRLLAL